MSDEKVKYKISVFDENKKTTIIRDAWVNDDGLKHILMNVVGISRLQLLSLQIRLMRESEVRNTRLDPEKPYLAIVQKFNV